MQRAVKGTAHRVNAVRAINGCPGLFRSHQTHRHMDAADDKYAFLRLDLSGNFGGQFSVAGIDLARLQRTSEGAHHSTSGRRNNIVNGRRVRFLQSCRVNFVVLGDGPMDTVDHRLGLAWQMCDTKGSLPAFDSRLRGIDDITHGLLLSELHNRISCKVEKLFMLNSLRRSFEVKGQNLQLPFYRHGRGRIANRLVARLILQITGNGNSPLLRKDRADRI